MNPKPETRGTLDKSAVPLYLQVATVVRRRINSGKWDVGWQLPTIEELMQEFGVGRVTVRQALDIVEQEGLIHRQRGRGTFVSENARSREWLTLTSSWSSLMRATEGTETETLASKRGVEPPALHPDEGTPAAAYQYLRRVHRLEGLAYAVLDLYVDQAVHDRAPPGFFGSQTVLRAMAAMDDVAMGRAWQTLTIDTADLETAILLDVPINDPVAEVRRVVLDPEGTVIYFGHLVYRGDFVRFRIDLGD